jgi:signal transduction histidine kinase
MEPIFQQTVEILTTLPVSLYFHLGLAAFLLSALQPAFISGKLEGNPAGNRLVIGLSLLLLGQVILFLASGLAWQNLAGTHLLLPLLDRLVFSLSLLWTGWMWAYPYRRAAADAACMIASVLLLILFAISLAYGSAQDASLPFNRSWLDTLWVGLALAGAVGLAIPLFIRRPAGWLLGLFTQGLLAAGILAHLYLDPASAGLSGSLRLAQLACFPLILILPYRGRLSRPVPLKPSASHPARIPERRRFSTDGKTLRAFLSLATEVDPDQLGTAITRMIAHVMVADLCYLASQPDRRGSITLEAGYDLIREAVLPGASLQTQGLPELGAAIQHGRPIRLSSDVELPPDLKYLGEQLKLAETGNLLYVPLFGSADTSEAGPLGGPLSSLLGGVILLSPYSHRTWTLDDQTYLNPVSSSLTNIIERVRNTALLQHELSRAHIEMKDALANTLAAAPQSAGLPADLPVDLQILTPSPEPDLETLLAIQQEYQDIINRLQAENIHLQEVAAHTHNNRRDWGAGEDWQLEKDLYQALDQVARLQTALEDAQGRIDLLEEGPKSAGEVSSRLELPMQEVDLLEIVDQASAGFSAELREKDLTLLVDLEDNLPLLQANPEALKQVLHYFIANASQVSSPGGTMALKIFIEHKNIPPSMVCIQVQDSGGGIPEEALPRLYASLYHPQEVQIPGLGSASYPLCNIRAVVEAHNGYLRIDTEAGTSTTFTVLLPVLHPQPVLAEG